MPLPRIRVPLWGVAAAGAGLVVVVGLLPERAAIDAAERLAPVLVFLIAVTALAGIADAAGVFEAAAVRAARVAGGRTPVLFVLVVLLASLTTVLLSLDTTAVLLTPVVLALARRLALPPLAFAFATVWLANTASLLLPVSNLTNLLSSDRLHLSALGFAGRLALPALAAVLVTVTALVLAHFRTLRGRYEVPRPEPPADRVLFFAAVTAITVLAATLVAGIPPAPATAVLAVALGGCCAVRRPSLLRPALVPWRLVPLVLGLFLLVQAAGPLGLDRLLVLAAGGGDDGLRVAAAGALASNGLNNLPAFLALERVVPDRALPALLIGVNVGPLVLPWASLATLLWADRCRVAGVQVPWRTFVWQGALLVPVLLVVCVAAL